MKTLKANRTRKIMLMGLALFALIATMCILTNPVKGAGVTVAMGIVVGGVTLEGKEEALYNALKESIQAEVNKHAAGYISETKMTENINNALAKFTPNIKENEDLLKLATKLEGALTTLAEHGIKMKAITDSGIPTKGIPTIKAQLKEHMEKNKEAWMKMKSPGAPSIEIELKVAGTMMEDTHTAGSAYVTGISIEPGFVDIARQQPTLLQYMNYAGTTSRTIVWIEKTNPDGNAQWIGEGDVKPLVDFEWKSNTTQLKKVPAKSKVSTEMLDDIDFMDGEIRNELKYQVDMAVDTAILSGAGGDSIYGITHWASAYALTTIKTTTPNNYDAIKAAATQVRNLFFQPNLCIVNPIDAANMEITKDADGGYVMPPFSTVGGKNIAGLRVVESPAIPVGYLLVGDMTKVKIREKGTFVVTVGWVNDDFEKNLVTMIGERRMHLFIADNDTSAFIYDTFENIKTAVTQL